MEIKEYIESGILEAYVLGSASEQEAQQLLQFKKQYPEIQTALDELETDMERIASYMAVTPPPRLWDRIEDNLNELVISHDLKPAKRVDEQYKRSEETSNQQFIEVEGSSSHMRIHKLWRWVFAAVFVLGKIFLGFAIYYYLESRQAKEQIQELKTELKLRR